MNVEHRTVIEVHELVLAAPLDATHAPAACPSYFRWRDLPAKRWMQHQQSHYRLPVRRALQGAPRALDLRQLGHRVATAFGGGD
jgi:hypothetical protein